MIIKSFSIPSPTCVRSVFRPMTADEIRLMNEQIAARRNAILAAYRNLTPEQQANVCEELAELETVSDWQDERNSRPSPY